MVTTFTRLAGPSLPGDAAQWLRTGYDLDITADAAVVAQVSYPYVAAPSSGGSPQWGQFPQLNLWYRDAAGTTYTYGPQIQTHNCSAARFHPSGDFLAVSLSPSYPAGVETPGLRMYRRSTAGGFDGGQSTGLTPGRPAFDATGRWMALAGGYDGSSGLAAFDPQSGAVRWTGDAPDGAYWMDAAFSPADPTLLAAATDSRLMFYRRDAGGALSVLGAGGETYGSTFVTWHPSGAWVVADTYDDDLSCQVPDAYTPDGLRFHRFGELTQVGTVRFNAAGDLMFAGMVVLPDPDVGFACGNGVPDGLLVLSVAGSTASGLTTAPVWHPHADGVQISGAQIAVAETGGALSLAVATSPDQYHAQNIAMRASYDPGVEAWPVQAPGFAVYGTAAPATTTSNLYMRRPDGTYVLVGAPGQPLSVRLPDGSQRTWPGSGFPLYMKQPDGSWRKVVA